VSTPKARWRQVFDKVERAVGGPLEDAVNSPRYAVIMTTGIRTRRALTDTASGLVGGVAGVALRALNIPTRDDVQRINRNLSALAGELRAISAQLADPAAPGGTAATRQAQRRAPAPRRVTTAGPSEASEPPAGGPDADD
jgi:hypothetical protein